VTLAGLLARLAAGRLTDAELAAGPSNYEGLVEEILAAGPERAAELRRAAEVLGDPPRWSDYVHVAWALGSATGAP
jgi:hypothetical protein